ncbi:MAG: FAD-dependent oxidoreductase, partial [Chloroflexi bacterium]|nr:FAD-dependent oxidoreductase [Chloroflexota bacterium]
MPGRRVIVIGSGASGMAAALAASSQGASVTVLEKAAKLGGTTAWGGGGIWIPGNPYTAAEGLPDTFEDALLYLRSVGLGDSDPTLAERYVRQGVRVVAATQQHAGVHWNTIYRFPDYHAELPGGRPQGGRSLEIDSVTVGPDMLAEMRPNPYGAVAASRREIEAGIDEAERAHRDREGIAGKGVGLAAAMRRAVRQLGGSVLAGRRVERLIVRDGAVCGVEAGGETFEGNVVVATGGFERDPALVRSFL